MTGPLVVEPVFKERVWGGTTLKEWFGELVPPGTIGECWAISGLPGDSGRITAGPGEGGTLDEAWRSGLITGEPREDDFPILVKFLDPTDWLSVQVHPNDEQAQRLEGMPRGKAECWYVIDCAEGSDLILGHTEQSADALKSTLADGTLDEHLLRQQVGPGSFFMVPAGCVHAVGPGMLVYEVQQSSDITYRLYDFDRPGLDGNPRELHVDKGFSVVTAPYDLADSFTAGESAPIEGGSARTLVAGQFFKVTEITADGEVPIGGAGSFRLVSVVRGSGELVAEGGVLPAPRGSCFVLPAGASGVALRGNLTAIVTDPA